MPRLHPKAWHCPSRNFPSLEGLAITTSPKDDRVADRALAMLHCFFFVAIAIEGLRVHIDLSRRHAGRWD